MAMDLCSIQAIALPSQPSPTSHFRYHSHNTRPNFCITRPRHYGLSVARPRLPTRTMAQDGPPSLEIMPVELLVQIFTELDLEDALALAKTSLLLARVFKDNWNSILLPILSREFSPVESLLRIPHPDYEDRPLSAWHRPRTYFGGILISKEEIKEVDDKKAFPDGKALPELRFERKHMGTLIRRCRVVKKWEYDFPSLRFSEHDFKRRLLKPHENERLRHALYAWWHYAWLFHRDHEGPSWARSRGMPDIRCNNLRQMTTLQLYQLQDLWKTLRAEVSRLCPSVSKLLREEVTDLPAFFIMSLLTGWQGDHITPDYAERVGWGDGDQNRRIVATFMKLAPDGLLHLCSDPQLTASRESLIRQTRFVLHPGIENGFESLSDALWTVLQERTAHNSSETGLEEYLAEGGYPGLHGGILDVPPVLPQGPHDEYGSDGGQGLDEYDANVEVPFSNEPTGLGLLDPDEERFGPPLLGMFVVLSL